MPFLPGATATRGAIMEQPGWPQQLTDVEGTVFWRVVDARIGPDPFAHGGNIVRYGKIKRFQDGTPVVDGLEQFTPIPQSTTEENLLMTSMPWAGAEAGITLENTFIKE
jgi:hypothetical protein